MYSLDRNGERALLWFDLGLQMLKCGMEFEVLGKDGLYSKAPRRHYLYSRNASDW